MAVATFDTEQEYLDFCELSPVFLPEEYEVFYDCGSSVLNELPIYKTRFEGASSPSCVVFVGY
jgi:hypothetical protein